MHKILVADDEKDITTMIKTLIESQLKMCEVTTTSNGLDSFIACQKQKFDLIITDHKMPFMTGAAFVIAVRTKENESTDSPIVMLSAYIDAQLKSKLKIQNVKFVEKPFTTDDFLDVIRTYLV